MDKQRRHFTSEEKVRILRRHLVEKVPVSALCEELGIPPTQFYRWQQIFFENGSSAFDRPSKVRPSEDQERIAALEQKLKRKHEVLSELMEEHVALKKSLGEL
jgi:transposase-like protein